MQVSLVHKECAYPLDAVPPDLLVEHDRCRLRLEEHRSKPDLDAYQAEAGEVPLPLVRERAVGERVLLEWEWTPEFFTGEFTFVIRYQGERIYPPAYEERRLLVQPDLHKLTATHYEAMVTDLVQWSEGWLTSAPGQAWGTSSMAPADSPLAQLELLHRQWDTVERLVDEAVARPKRKLSGQTVQVPLHRVQMVTGQQWQSVVDRPWLWSRHPAQAKGPLARVQTSAAGLLPQLLPQASAYSTLALPENIFVATMLTDIRQGLTRAMALLEGFAPGPQRAVAERRSEQARIMLKRVAGWLRDTWLTELDPAPGQIAPTPALLKHPVYGSLWRFYLRWRRAVTLFDGADRPLPLDKTYQLYEYWSLLMVVRAVARYLGRDPDAAVDGVMRRSGAALRLFLEPGKTLVLPFQAEGVTVTYQQSFRYRPESDRLHSFSHMQIPDITIEWTGADGAPCLLLFDPKYRVNHEGVLGGLGDMHRYRDAIVTGEGRRAVLAGFLLCPGEPTDPGDRKYLRPEYQEQWNFGICRLSPEGGESDLFRLLAQYLGKSNAAKLELH